MYSHNQVKGDSRRLYYKNHSYGPWNDTGETGGYCKKCGQFDNELKNNCCRHDECKSDRFMTTHRKNDNGHVTTIRIEKW